MASGRASILCLLCCLGHLSLHGASLSSRDDGSAGAGALSNKQSVEEPFSGHENDHARVGEENARVQSGRTALDDFVWKEDDHYRWHDTGQTIHGLLPINQWRGYILNMTSQKWLSSASVNPSVWTHHLVVVVPAKVTVDSTVLLLVAGGSNGDPPPTSKNQQIRLAANAAMQTGSVTAVLFQVPNQPTVFPGDPWESPLREDDIIAYTWRHFVDHADEAEAQEWPLRLPMTKAVVRAMDTVQDFAWSSLGLKVRRFVVAGASKRGWTTWTTAAVDKRVVGMIPMVMDALDLVRNMHHFFKSLGGWPLPFKPYYDRNLTHLLDSRPFHKLLEIVDPYVYLDRLTMPKMIVIAANDEFFMPDDSQFYKEKLRGESHFLILPNTDHSLFTGLPKLTAAIHAFYASICADFQSQLPGLLASTIGMAPRNWMREFGYRGLSTEAVVVMEGDQLVPQRGGGMRLADMSFRLGRPRFKWELDREHGSIRVLTWEKPLAAALWYAHTPRSSIRRDFRFVTANYGNCTLKVGSEGCLQPIVFHRRKLRPLYHTYPNAVMEFKAKLEKPKEGFAIFFIELKFVGLTRRLKFHFTTEAVVVPRRYPFHDCQGEDCYGVLV